MPRRMVVEVIGDADSYVRAARQAVNAGAQMQRSFDAVDRAQSGVTRGAASMGRSVGGGFTNAAYGAARALEQIGNSADVAARAGGFFASIMNGDVVGAVDAARGSISLTNDEMRAAADTMDLYTVGIEDVAAALEVMGQSDAAQTLFNIRSELEAIRAEAFALRQFNVSGSAPVRFRGSPDDRGGIRGVGLAESVEAAPDETTQADIDKTVDVFKNIEKQIVEMRRRAKVIVENARKAAAEAREAKFADILAGLELGVDRARLTAGLNNDLQSLFALQEGLQQQIAAGVDVRDAQKRLVAVMGEIASTRREIQERAEEAFRASRQARQFRALGLDESGEEIVPGVKNLETRIKGALARINSGQLDVSSKLVDRLKLARNLIRKEGRALTEETRDTINDLIKTVTRGADQLSKGPLTRTSSLNAQKVLEGLGLGRDVEKELRSRLSSFNTAGVGLAGTQRSSGNFRGGQAITVDNHNTIVMDGDVVARNTTRSQQKQRRRNPVQKRGGRSGI